MKQKMKKLKVKIAAREEESLRKLEEGRSKYPSAIDRILVVSNKVEKK